MLSTDSVIEAIYAAALDPERWPAALQAISACFDDVGAVLLFERDDGSVGSIVSPALAAAHKEYEANWATRDLRSQRGLERGYLMRGDVVTDRDLVTPDEIATDPVYREFLIPWGLGWCAAVSILPRPRNAVWISVQRSIHKPAFCDDELAKLGRLGRHAETALRIGMRLIEADAAKAGLSRLLAELDCGVLLVGAEGNLVFANALGERAFATEKTLGAQIASHCTGAVERGETSAPTPFIVRRASGPIVVRAFPIPTRVAADMFGGARYAAVFADDAPKGEPDPALLRDLLGLTLAEARVASLIGSGTPPKAASQRLGIAEHTVRDCLKKIFDKTGIHRQTDLALLLARLPT